MSTSSPTTKLSRLGSTIEDINNPYGGSIQWSRIATRWMGSTLLLPIAKSSFRHLEARRPRGSKLFGKEQEAIGASIGRLPYRLERPMALVFARSFGPL